MREEDKDEDDGAILCGGSYEKSQAACDQGTISDPDTEGQVKGNQSMVRKHNVSYTRRAGADKHAEQGNNVIAGRRKCPAKPVSE
jgi:hypothetical protein